jgi:hypothetical protein
MKCIVPLAGPDLLTEAYGFRPLMRHDGQTLIERALKPRAWAGRLKASDYIFVVRQVEGLATLTDYLSDTWPGCQIVTLSHLTGGALYSVLAGVSLCAPNEPFIVDLADMLFDEGPSDPETLMRAGFASVVPVFTSDDPIYSYLRTEAGEVVEACEKVVISDKASAGVYMFDSPQRFLRAAAHSMDHIHTLGHRGLLFICPMINGVIADAGRVSAPHIATISPVGKIFHS